ncbi:hypothetical protein [Actinomadura sp. WMMB 499]|uniref:hypothetical protein n=1 Tax=Actinomadura sp. WMMB 499 TaxID=1219491 RepID=UPI0012445D59|nr:hypothetical protein [Actinomadura sp. WMMB 499]QFG21171.1 hypothetical protein F7P10_08475 [Actinomadura sp. WMMB 499]
MQSGWIEELEHRTLDPAGDPGGPGVVLVCCMLAYTALLWTAVVLSVVKPGGRTRWGRAGAPADRRAGEPARPPSPAARRLS